MTSNNGIQDLPAGVIKQIVSCARGSRRIAGTNRYARVCKAWQQATSADPDHEALHLYLDQEALSKEQTNTSTRWLARYGSHVAALALNSTSWSAAKTLLGLPGFGTNLKELNLNGTNSLVGLLAAKVQLPKLQRLSASLSQYKAWWVDPATILLSDVDKAAGKPYPLQQACPGLTHLYLELNGHEPHAQPTFNTVDQLLPQLLPPTLQKLRLCWEEAGHNAQSIQLGLALVHLTALQQLELDTFFVKDAASPLVLPPDCTMQLWSCSNGLDLPAPDCWAGFNDRLTGLFLFRTWDAKWASVSHHTGLTGLFFRTPPSRAPQHGDGRFTSGLTSLVKLDLLETMFGDPKITLDILQPVRSTTTLRCLKLDTTHMVQGELLAAVGALTQLTSLYLHSDSDVRLARLPGQEQLLPMAPAAPVMPLQHLVGLRQLQLSATYLLQHPTGWLGHLTQLTLLGVLCDVLQYRVQERGLGAAQQVEHCSGLVVPRLLGSCPSSLQQVVLYIYDVSLREVLPSPLPGVPVYVRGEWLDVWLTAPEGRFVPRFAASMQPCPHLPGVWELL